MKRESVLWALSFLIFQVANVEANPYPDPRQVPQDARDKSQEQHAPRAALEEVRSRGHFMLRVDVDWTENGEIYQAARFWKERSGTSAALARARVQDSMGSYQAVLKSASNGQVIGYDALGTGKEFRKLVRTLAFRFPVSSDEEWVFELTAEHPETGIMTRVLERKILPQEVVNVPELMEPRLEVRTIRSARAPDPLVLAIYAEGFTAARASVFWGAAERAAKAFESWRFPMLENLEIIGVFAESKLPLGQARDLGMPVPERDSFLGLYYPYWNNFGRWYHILYPTRETRFRNALAQVPYDYPLAIVDSDLYWGVGNYKELTAIPSSNSSFTYLLMHEFGHFLGLNEEYEGGGRTELEFAPQIAEPWSPNLTFLGSTSWADLKWKEFAAQSTPLPTPGSYWRSGRYGAYRGGYGDSAPGRSHKPGMNCVMHRSSQFCPICLDGMRKVMSRDLGR